MTERPESLPGGQDKQARVLPRPLQAGGADLHLHSWYSDGTWAPTEVVSRAAHLGLNPIALTDHDTVGGIAEARRAGSEFGIEVIPGVELSARDRGREIHLLGYFIDWKDPQLSVRLHRLTDERQARLNAILARLQDLGIPLTRHEVEHLGSRGTIGRLHVARALVARGAVASIEEAFSRYLGHGKPAHVEHSDLGPEEAIGLLRQVGGVPVLAHPGHGFISLLPQLVAAGLAGLEVHHPSHSPEKILLLLQAASKFGLVVTGGSDCHGLAKGEPLIGRTRLGPDHVAALRARWRRETRRRSRSATTE
ncbi:MAG: PHP domain-containing protein [Candidatus Methylomirabilales bacterium]